MSKMSELLIAGHSTVRWRTEEEAVGFNFGTLKSASAFENSSTRTKAPLHDTSDKPCKPGALTKNWRRPLRGDRDAAKLPALQKCKRPNGSPTTSRNGFSVER